jgi:NADH-quinone oxidoreductase subunit L
MGNIHLFSNLVDKTLPPIVINTSKHIELLLQLLSVIIAMTGIYIAYLIYLKKPSVSERFTHSRVNNFLEKGWGFDRLYEILFVRPAVWLADIDKNDFFDSWNKGLSGLAIFLNGLLSNTQNGKTRWYLLSFILGIAIILTYMLGK